MNPTTPALKIDFCTFEAAKYAVEHFHYSGTMPTSKTVKIGVWENEKFVGCVIFSRGATPNIGKPYNLPQTEVCELTRVALTDHKTSTTRIIRFALQLLKQTNPGLRLVVSYADLDYGHKGIIYRAGNWVHEGIVKRGTLAAFLIHGKRTHPRSLAHYGEGAETIAWVRKNLDPNATTLIAAGKHKYLYALDEEMKCIIEARRKPYSEVV